MPRQPNKKEMKALENQAKDLGAAISDAEQNGVELQNSPDFWQAFVGLNDMLAGLGFGEEED